MSRSYRMRYHTEAPNPLIVEPHRQTQITVRTMTGAEHILFTERAGETYGDVKRAVFPHLVLEDVPFIVRSQVALVLKNNDGTYSPILNDAEIVPENDVELELLLKEPTWTPEQEEVFRYMKKFRGEIIRTNRFNTPDKMEAILWYLQTNSPPKLVMESMNIHQIRAVLNVLRNTSIQTLMLSSSVLAVDEMSEVFEMIGQINTLRSLTIRSNLENIYRMSDLVELLRRNTSLREVTITNCEIVFEGDVRTVADELRDVLDNQHTLEKLLLGNNKCHSPENAREFINSIPSANRVESDGNIYLRWTTNPNL